MNYEILAKNIKFLPNSPLTYVLDKLGLGRKLRRYRSRKNSDPRLKQNYPEMYDLFWSDKIDSLISESELIKIFEFLENTSGDNKPIIELGSYKCGTTIMMAKYLDLIKDPRWIIACDSFVGVPSELTNMNSKYALNDTSYDDVQKRLQKFGVDERVQLVKGYFDITLPKLDFTYSFAFLDSDTYESGVFALPYLYERTDGIIAVHDYIQGLPIKKALDEFAQKIPEPLIVSDIAHIVKRSH